MRYRVASCQQVARKERKESEVQPVTKEDASLEPRRVELPLPGQELSAASPLMTPRAKVRVCPQLGFAYALPIRPCADSDPNATSTLPGNMAPAEAEALDSASST